MVAITGVCSDTLIKTIVVIDNVGINDVNSVKIDWTVDGKPQTQNSHTTTLKSGFSRELTLSPTFKFVDGTTYSAPPSDALGDYSITGIPGTATGSYHLDFSKTGYSDTHQTFTMTSTVEATHISLSPDLTTGQYRVVLNWDSVDDMNLGSLQKVSGQYKNTNSTVTEIPGTTFNNSASGGYGPESLTFDTTDVNLTTDSVSIAASFRNGVILDSTQ